MEDLDQYGIRGRSSITFSLYVQLLRVIVGFMVAQLKIIFSPDYTKNYHGSPFLAYVQPFRLASSTRGKADPGIHMYRVSRDLRSDRTRKGLVVPLTDIWRPVELIPKFGCKCDITWTCDTAVEHAKEFYLNCFADKPTYIEVY